MKNKAIWIALAVLAAAFLFKDQLMDFFGMEEAEKTVAETPVKKPMIINDLTPVTSMIGKPSKEPAVIAVATSSAQVDPVVLGGEATSKIGVVRVL